MADTGDVAVKISGDEELARALRTMAEDLERVAPPDAATALETAASAACPHRTGALAASLVGRVEQGRVVLTSHLRYARPVAAKTGFVGRALAASGPEVQRAYVADLQAACERVHNAS